MFSKLCGNVRWRGFSMAICGKSILTFSSIVCNMVIFLNTSELKTNGKTTFDLNSLFVCYTNFISIKKSTARELSYDTEVTS